MGSSLALFVGVSALVICTPGPDTALTIRNALSGGRHQGVLTAAGVASGQLVWTAAASLGLAGIIKASEPAFTALKFVGAAYLMFLGGQSLWAAWRGQAAHWDAGPPRPSRWSGRALRQGLLSDLANPKMAAFFLSLLPQFAPSGHVATSLGLGTVFGLMTFGWLTLYAVLFDRLRRLLHRSRVRRVLEAGNGAVLVALGLRIATEPS